MIVANIELIGPLYISTVAGAPKAYVQYGFGAPVEAAVVSLGDGKYGLRFVPPNEGKPNLTQSSSSLCFEERILGPLV